MIRVVHYLNQFFGGIGGEEKADAPPRVVPGAVGPGRALQRQWQDAATIIATLICGDNFMSEHVDDGLAVIREALETYRPDVVVAGPAFNAGRYGLACAWVCGLAQDIMGIPALTAMHPENPGVHLSGGRVYTMACAASVAGMPEIIPPLAQFALRLGRRAAIGSAQQEGYLPRGLRHNARVLAPAHERAVGMLLAKLRGQSFRTEIPRPAAHRVPAPPPLQNLRSATVAIVTEAGIVPTGNPDRIEHMRATKWARYSFAGCDTLAPGTYESVHGGYDATWVNEDPNRAVPVDALRQLERSGEIGHLLEEYYVTVGNGGQVADMVRFAAEIAEELKARGVTAVVSPAT
jgi:glycine reductase complex component B subunit gamma